MLRFKEEFHIIEKVKYNGENCIAQFYVKSGLGEEYIIRRIPLPTKYVMCLKNYN